MEAPSNSIARLPSKFLGMPGEALGRQAGKQVLGENVGQEESCTLFNGEIERSTKSVKNKTKDATVEPRRKTDFILFK